MERENLCDQRVTIRGKSRIKLSGLRKEEINEFIKEILTRKNKRKIEK